MSLDISGLGQAASAAKGILELFFPNKSEEERQQIALSLAVIQSQQKINEIEAAAPSLFVAGGRPAVIWVGAIGLALAFWPKAIVLAIFWSFQAWVSVANAPSSAVAQMILPAYPDLGMGDLFGLLGSLLGCAALRSVDKSNGVATNAISPPKGAGYASAPTNSSTKELNIGG